MRENKTFTECVYEVVSLIPKGSVLTYKEVARKAGNEKAVRAVGTAMKKNVDTKKIPCHRVVGSDGSMHGYAFGGEAKKIEMLKKEGLVFKGNKVDLNLGRYHE